MPHGPAWIASCPETIGSTAQSATATMSVRRSFISRYLKETA